MSGNKLIYLFLAVALTVSTASCELFKPVDTTGGSGQTDDRRPPREGEDDLDPVQSRRVYDPETGTYVYVTDAPTEPMDTIEWTTVPETRRPPIVEDGSAAYVPPPTAVDPMDSELPPVRQTGTTPSGSRLLSGYGIDFALPFLADRYLGSEDRLDPNSLWALHFFSGAEMALAERQGKPITYNVRVQDSKATPQRVQQIVGSPEFRSSHLIIGPYVKEGVTVAAEAVRGMEQVLVSPYSAATGVSEANPNYLQVNPTLETHLRAQLEHAYRSQGADRIVLVAGPTHRSRLAIYQDEYRILTGNPEGEPLEELIVEGTNVSVRPYLSGRKTVFLLPIYSDENFVSNFLRQLYQVTRGDMGEGVAVYGMPQWMNFERINLDYMEGNNVHVSSSVYVDLLDPDVRQFRSDFFERYQTLPRDEAYVGYDVTRYFMDMLAAHGTRFQYALEDNPADMLHTSFRFRPVTTIPADATSLEQAVTDRFENRYLNILRFRDYEWRKVN